MKKLLPKIIIIVFVVLAFYIFKHYQLSQYLSLEYIKFNQDTFRQFYLENQAQTILVYFLIYVIATALSIPGATVLTLSAGALLVFLWGY